MMILLRSSSINFPCQGDLYPDLLFSLKVFGAVLVLIVRYRDVKGDQIMVGQTVNRKSMTINYVIFHIFGPKKTGWAPTPLVFDQYRSPGLFKNL